MSDLNHLPDKALYLLLKNDNQRAFNLLYQRYWKRMLHKAALKLRDPNDAEEVVQDAFADIWSGRHRIDIQHGFHTYISAIVKYKIMAKIAAVHKEQHYESDTDVATLALADHTTEEWLSFQDLRADIENAVQTLPEKCQMVFRMSREKGKSDKEIARDLNVSQKTVEAHITRALKILRASINQFLFLF